MPSKLHQQDWSGIFSADNRAQASPLACCSFRGMRKEPPFPTLQPASSSLPDLATWHRWFPNWSSFKLARGAVRARQHSKACQAKEPTSSLPTTHSSKKFRSYSLPVKSAAFSETAVLNEQDAPTEPKHLVVFVHGLWGTRNDWRNIYRHFSSILPSSTYLLHVSTANEWLNTYSGVDVCGQRLAAEMKEIVDKNPSLAYISIIGHSLGGLISRYAAGCSYDPTTGQILGLQPCHFITLATPHMGATWTGTAQVPLIHTFTNAPIVGSLLQNLQSKLQPTTGFWLGRTGEMLFHLDAASAQDGQQGRKPLLETMCWDQPEQNMHCYSALASFKTRTCYANAVGDHMVGWANASVRRMDQLPSFTEQHLKGACGVIAEDSLPAAHDLSASLHFLHQQGPALAERCGAALQKANSARSTGTSPSRWRTSSPFKSRTLANSSADDLSSGWLSRSPRGLKVSRTFTAVAAKLGIDLQGNAVLEGSNELDSSKNDGVRGSSAAGIGECGAVGIAAGALVGVNAGTMVIAVNTTGSSTGSKAVGENESGAFVENVTVALVESSTTVMASTSNGGASNRSGAPADSERVVQVPGPSSPLIPANSYNRSNSSASLVTASSTGLDEILPVGSAPSAAPDPVSKSVAISGSSGDGGMASVHAAAASAAAAVEAAAESVLRADSSSALLERAGNRQQGGAAEDGVALRILDRLQTLAWRRIDVSFKGAVLGFAHNNIQYNRSINYAGKSVISHLANSLMEMEASLQLPYTTADTIPAQQGSPQKAEAAAPVAAKLSGESTLTPQEDDQISAGLFSQQDL